jgi:beta-xylosidase
MLPRIWCVGGKLVLTQKINRLSCYSANDKPGNAICRQGQLSLHKADTGIWPQKKTNDVMLTTGGLYAPTIRYRGGTFYVVCTNVLHNQDSQDETQNFIVSTRDIWTDKWSDPTYFNFKGIDPSILFDDDGRTYIQGSRGPGPFTTINQFEIDLESGELLSPEKTIWTGTGGIYPEGPHLYKHNGWYYLVVSEGGTHENHMITTARSQNVWGPYVAYDNNPILTARGTSEYIRYTGHLDAFQDDKGNWWGVCLGVRKDSGGRFIMGRETFLTPGNWDGEWLSLETVIENPRGLIRPEGQVPISAAPDLDFLYIRDADLNRYKIENGGGKVTLTPTSVDLSSPNVSPTFVGKRQRVLTGMSTVSLQLSESWTNQRVKAGMACYKDEHRYIRFYLDASIPAISAEVVNNGQKISRSEEHKVKALSTLKLRVSYTEQEYRLLYQMDNDLDQEWITLMVVDTLELTDPDFVGMVIGIFAWSAEDGVNIEFSRLSIQ